MSAQLSWTAGMLLSVISFLGLTAIQSQALAAGGPTTKPSAAIVVYVVDSNNQPVSGATVLVYRARPRQSSIDANDVAFQPLASIQRIELARHHRRQPMVQGHTNGNGKWSSPLVPLGSYVVWAEKTGFGRGRASTKLTSADSGETIDVTITLKS